jgi:hypothetical protein
MRPAGPWVRAQILEKLAICVRPILKTSKTCTCRPPFGERHHRRSGAIGRMTRDDSVNYEARDSVAIVDRSERSSASNVSSAGRLYRRW